jgi:hypothetical protein
MIIMFIEALGVRIYIKFIKIILFLRRIVIVLDSNIHHKYSYEQNKK